MRRIDESYSASNGQVRRIVRVVGERSCETLIQDRSRLSAEHSAWARWWRSYLFGAPVKCASPPTRGISIADLFCGCGGLTLGSLEAATALGLAASVRLAVDSDRGALAVYVKNFSPERPLCENVASLVDYRVSRWGQHAQFAYDPTIVHPTLRALEGTIDLVVAGPPCQGHSNLNNHTRRNDPRNLLYVDSVGLAVALGARAIILENVPDIVNDRKEVFTTAQALLTRAGYRTTYCTLAAHELGWPQTRKRLFLVASRLPLIDLREISQALKRRPATVRWAIGDLPETGMHTIMDSVPALSAENRRRIDYLFDNDLYDLPDHLRPPCHRQGHTYPSVYGRLRWDAPAGTITTGFVTPGRGRFIHPAFRRPLTPREAARLQGFPDSFAFIPDRSKQPNKSALTKWIGDAVPPILGYAAALSALACFTEGG